MQRPAPRPVLAKAANAGAHPAAPPPIDPAAAAPIDLAPLMEHAEGTQPPESSPAPLAAVPDPPPEPVVMFSVRIPQSLRRAVKLAAVEQESTIEDWVEVALRSALH